MSTTIEKNRPTDVLKNYPEDQQNRILDRCGEPSYRELIKKIAPPPPEGLGLPFSFTSPPWFAWPCVCKTSG